MDKTLTNYLYRGNVIQSNENLRSDNYFSSNLLSDCFKLRSDEIGGNTVKKYEYKFQVNTPVETEYVH